VLCFCVFLPSFNLLSWLVHSELKIASTINQRTNTPFNCRKCTTFSALFQLDPQNTFQSLFITQYKNSMGVTVTLPSPIILQLSIVNSTVQIPLQFQRTLWNKVENFQPIENCPIGNRYGPCFNSTTPYVLCCMGNANRGNGIHCMIQDSSRYDVFQMLDTKLIHNVQILATAKAKTLEFDLNQDYTSRSFYDFGQATISIIPRIENVRPTNIRFPWLVFSTENTSLTSWFLINRYETNFQQFTRTPQEWKALATCDGQLHDQTATHNDQAHIIDQYYPFRSNTIPLFFTQYGRNFAIVPKGDLSLLTMDVKPDTILVQVTLQNIE
jgi:hypothetical protein